jgi:putative aldouronate transport system permease protein
MIMVSAKFKDRSGVVFNTICYLFILVVAFISFVPVLMLIAGSFTSEHAIRFSGYSLIPKEWSTSAYALIFRTPMTVMRAYGVSILITVVGTCLGLFVTTLAAYVISRKDFKYRNLLSFFFYFTTLFNGGMLSTYIFFIRYYHLKNSLWALIIPGLFNVFYLLIMRSFISAVPTALIESAEIDGAGEYRTFFQIIFPLLQSGLATIGLFMALGYWNDWYNAMLYINSTDKYPLQYMLYTLLQKTEAMSRIASSAGIPLMDMPSNSLKMAMAVVATGPIILVYPFVQKYFVRGITIGSVKG